MLSADDDDIDDRLAEVERSIRGVDENVRDFMRAKFRSQRTSKSDKQKSENLGQGDRKTSLTLLEDTAENLGGLLAGNTLAAAKTSPKQNTVESGYADMRRSLSRYKPESSRRNFVSSTSERIHMKFENEEYPASPYGRKTSAVQKLNRISCPQGVVSAFSRTTNLRSADYPDYEIDFPRSAGRALAASDKKERSLAAPVIVEREVEERRFEPTYCRRWAHPPIEPRNDAPIDQPMGAPTDKSLNAPLNLARQERLLRIQVKKYDGEKSDEEKSHPTTEKRKAQVLSQNLSRNTMSTARPTKTTKFSNDTFSSPQNTEYSKVIAQDANTLTKNPMFSRHLATKEQRLFHSNNTERECDVANVEGSFATCPEPSDAVNLTGCIDADTSAKVSALRQELIAERERNSLEKTSLRGREDNLESHVRNLQRANEQLQSQLTSCMAELKTCNNRLQQAQQQTTKRENDLHRACEEIAALKEQKMDLESKWYLETQAGKTLESTLLKTEEKLQVALSEKRILESQIDDIKGRTDKANNEIRKTDQINRELRANLDQTTAAYSALQRKYDGVASQISSMELHMTELRSIITRKSEVEVENRKALASKRDRELALESEIASLRGELAAKQELASEVFQQRKENEILRESCKTLRDQIRDLTRAMTLSEKSRQEYRTRCKELANELVGVRQELATFKRRLQQAGSQARYIHGFDDIDMKGTPSNALSALQNTQSQSWNTGSETLLNGSSQEEPVSTRASIKASSSNPVKSDSPSRHRQNILRHSVEAAMDSGPTRKHTEFKEDPKALFTEFGSRVRRRFNVNDSSALTAALFGPPTNEQPRRSSIESTTQSATQSSNDHRESAVPDPLPRSNYRESQRGSASAKAFGASPSSIVQSLQKQLMLLQMEKSEVETLMSKLNYSAPPRIKTLHERSAEAQCEARLKDIVKLISEVKESLKKEPTNA